jgi:hypothetical protein
MTSVIPKWRTFKLLRWVQLFNLSVDFDEILYSGEDIRGDFEHSKMEDV